MDMRRVFAGNWKMNGLKAAIAEIRALNRAFAQGQPQGTILICPPSTLITEAVKAAEGSPVAIGGQDCHAQSSGAFTGEVSAEMLRDAGATWVIVGHSERRQGHGETDAIVAAKAKAARRAGITAIVCIGESEAERDSGRAIEVVTAQLNSSLPAELGPSDFVVAYEPIWAIGTGRTPKPSEIGEMHGALRALLSSRFGPEQEPVRVLYGGSVKPENAREILAVSDVDGALIGGASLKAGDFLAIVQAAPSR
jgi:triosephosphate isomerase